MSLSAKMIERIKKGGPKDELLISGYVRTNSLMSIPYALIQICIAYFLCIEEWDVKNKGKHLKISGIYDQICECTNPEQTTWMNYQSVLGTLRVDSGKHHWKFKITKLDHVVDAYWRIIIGVIKIDRFSQEDVKKVLESYLGDCCKMYGFVPNRRNNDSCSIDPYSGDSPLKAYTDCCKDVGDIIDMYLDIDNQRLCFVLKGKNHGDVYKENGIKIDKTAYKMGMTLSCIGTAVELVSYDQIEEIPQQD